MDIAAKRGEMVMVGELIASKLLSTRFASDSTAPSMIIVFFPISGR